MTLTPEPTAAGRGEGGRGGPSTQRAGIALAATAYLGWGLAPVYFKAVAHVPPLELLAHRVLWALVLLVAMVTARRRWARLRDAVSQRRLLLTLVASSALVGVNWLTFIVAIARDRVLEASLGYFVNPLVSVLLGVLLLGERLRRGQALAVILAAACVAGLTWHHGRLPALALVLAFSFASYGLLRKLARIDAVSGLLVECALLAPFMLGLLVALGARGGGSFAAGDPATSWLLVAAGPVTAVPLVLFAAAARRLPLTTLGLLQYLTPTGQFLLAIFAFGEPLGGARLLAFCGIWSALALYTADSLVHRRRSHPAPPPGGPDAGSVPRAPSP